ncbi:hypothetical protein LIER_03235 [Lithospermum erythrorhizon]|uniref:t-SNARE coiled-coil homology domain-containing protein n=1 Tax=Lithospermum erythrorhizon TaxID=34254 RepID=A0AAV3NSD7_LITER
MEGSHSRYGPHIDYVDSYIPVMMTSMNTIGKQIASLKTLVEDMAKYIQRQEESLSYIAGKIHDHERHTQAAEASLKSLPPEEAPNTFKDALETHSTTPYQASTMPNGQPEKGVKTLCFSMNGTIPAT